MQILIGETLLDFLDKIVFNLSGPKSTFKMKNILFRYILLIRNNAGEYAGEVCWNCVSHNDAIYLLDFVIDQESHRYLKFSTN